MGGGKSLEKASTLTLGNYAVDYESDYHSTSLSLDGVKNSNKAVVAADSVNSYNYEHFVEATVTETSTSTFVNKHTGKVVVEGSSTAEVQTVVGSYNDNSGRFIATTMPATGDQITPGQVYTTLYAEDATRLVSGAFGAVLVYEESHYIGNSDEKSTFVRVNYHVVSNGSSEVKNDYYKYEEDDDGNRTYSSTKVNESDFRAYTSDYAKGETKFAAEYSPADIYGKENKETGALASVTAKNIGDELVFYNDGAETTRLVRDGVGSAAYLGDGTMVYTKRVELAKGSSKANVVVPEEYEDKYYSYELHTLSLTDGKDSVLKYNVYIEAMRPLYNYQSKTYDALAISGYKLDGKYAQKENEFSYIVDGEFNINFDTTDICDLATNRYLELVNFGNGNYAVKNTNNYKLTPINDRFERTTSNTVSTYSYYENEKLFAIGSSKYGFADLNGKVVIEPIYRTALAGSSDITFYGGTAYVWNSVTGKNVFLSADGKETEAPQSDTVTDTTAQTTVTTQVQFHDGWYVVKTTTIDNSAPAPTYTYKTELFSFAGASLVSYDSYATISDTDNLVEIEYTDTNGDTKHDLVYLS